VIAAAIAGPSLLHLSHERGRAGNQSEFVPHLIGLPFHFQTAAWQQGWGIVRSGDTAKSPVDPEGTDRDEIVGDNSESCSHPLPAVRAPRRGSEGPSGSRPRPLW